MHFEKGLMQLKKCVNSLFSAENLDKLFTDIYLEGKLKFSDFAHYLSLIKFSDKKLPLIVSLLLGLLFTNVSFNFREFPAFFPQMQGNKISK